MITIRKATIEDIELISQFYKKLNDYEQQFSHEFNSRWAFTKKGRAFFENRLKGRNSSVLIAEDKEKPIGFSLAHIFRTGEIRNIPKIGVLEYLYVEPEYRKKGIGKILLDNVKKFFQDNNVSRIKLTTLSDNKNAIKFYEENGMYNLVTILEGDL